MVTIENGFTSVLPNINHDILASLNWPSLTTWDFDPWDFLSHHVYLQGPQGPHPPGMYDKGPLLGAAPPAPATRPNVKPGWCSHVPKDGRTTGILVFVLA